MKDVVKDLVLRVEVLHAGTRSEGRVGRLFRGDVEVTGHQVGDVAVDGDVRFRFRGHERPHLWSASGWALDDGPAEGA